VRPRVRIGKSDLLGFGYGLEWFISVSPGETVRWDRDGILGIKIVRVVEGFGDIPLIS
jgi:hypothetical protein